MGNIIQIAFKEGQFTHPCKDEIWQWDRGLKLQVSGLETDKTVRVHFSLEEIQGTAKRVDAEVVGGVIHADIPQFILAKENCYGMSTYKAYAWIYLTDGEVGETVREIIFTIKTRARPEDYVHTEEEIRVFDALKAYVFEKETCCSEERNTGHFTTEQSVVHEKTLEFGLDRVPTEAVFVPTAVAWCSLLSKNITIDGMKVTVTLQVGGLGNTDQANVGGFILYRSNKDADMETFKAFLDEINREVV